MTSPLNANLPPNLPPIGPRRVVYLEANRPPTVLDTKYRDGSYYEFNTEWRDKSTTPPNIYKLANILSKTNAVWVLVSGGSGTIINVDVDAATPPGVDPVTPTGSGVLTITGGQVATGTVGANVIRTHTTALNEFAVEIQRSTTAAAADSTLNGVAHFNSAQFTVDADGFVSLGGGGPAIDSINVDASTPPGTDPVVSDGAGQITVTGGQVAAGTTASVIQTNSLAANTYTIQVQRASAVASTDITKNGVAHFSSGHFTIDANGFVEAKAGTAASSSAFANAGVLSADSSQFSVDVNGWLQLKTGVTPYGVGNISIGYSGGTFTVAGYDGTALSATNPGIVWLQDKTTPGHLRRYLVTANQTFTDGSSGQIDNMRWGVTTGVNWALDAPFYLYAVTNDALDTIAFAISRVPHLTSSPAAAKIGKQGAVVNVSQSDMYLLPNVTVADYEQNPCTCLGAFRMQFAGATDSWTVQTLNATDGIGQFHEETWFIAPLGQMGATTSTYFITQAGTQPVFDSGQSSVSYRISKTGTMDWSMLLISCTTPGAGAAALTAALPLNTTFTGSQGPFGQFTGSFNTTGPAAYIVAGALSGANQMVFALDGAAANLTQAAILAGNAFQGLLTSALIQP
jgi:hypothetical protein